MKNEILMPKAQRPGEYVAFFTMQFKTGEGPGFVYLACDAFSEFAFNMGVEPNERSENVLKYIYLLTEDPEFLRHRHLGFTLVLDRFEELAARIDTIIQPVGGQLLFHKKFHEQIAKPLRNALKGFF